MYNEQMQNMIQDGQFGTSGPAYNPYMNQPNNMISFGAMSQQIQNSYAYQPQSTQGYVFQPAWTSGWRMNNSAERQFESELTKPKSSMNLTIKQLTKKKKWWKVF